jgi:hypothetical protein
LVGSLFETLADEGLTCVHWKSNEHLPAALKGETDLDLLVRETDRTAFEEIVAGLGFRPMRPPPGRRIPGVRGFLGLDPDTGVLVHLDVHYALILGERLVKNHHLPLEEWLMDSARELDGVLVPAPAKELLLLFVRSMLKTSPKQMLRSAIKGGSPLPERIRTEARWLAGRADTDQLIEAARSSGLGISAEDVVEFRHNVLAGALGWPYVWKMRKMVRQSLRPFRRRGPLAVAVKKAVLYLRRRPVARRLGLGLGKRRLEGMAPVLAVVGADGSGKTRLTRDLEEWLDPKLMVTHIYFGQPKKGVVFKLLNKPGSLARRHTQGDYASLGSLSRAIVLFSEAVKWVVLAGQRRGLAHRARRLSRTGQVVIAERYPLREFWSMATPMDGPRLTHSRSVLLAGWERRFYEGIGTPDLVLALRTDLETLRARKEDLTREEHIPKVEAMASLQPREDMVLIDAGSPYDQVLLEAKRAIWGRLVETD